MAQNQKKYLNLNEKELKIYIDNKQSNLRQIIIEIYNEYKTEYGIMETLMNQQISNSKQQIDQLTQQYQNRIQELITGQNNTQQNKPIVKGRSINIEQIKQQLGFCTQEQLAQYLGQWINNSDLIILLLDLHEQYKQIKRGQSQNGMNQFVVNQKQLIIIENLKQEIENLKQYSENQLRQFNETINQQDILVKNQKKTLYKNADQFIQIFGLIESLKNKSVNEKLKQFTAKRQEFQILEQLIQKLQQGWKELEQNNKLSDQNKSNAEQYIKYLEETINYMKNYVQLSQDFNQALNSIQQNEDIKEIYQIYKQIALILGNNIEVFKKIHERLDEILQQQKQYFIDYKNLQDKIKQKKNQIQQNKDAYIVEEKKLNQKNEQLEKELQRIQNQASIDQNQLQDSFLKIQKKKIDDFKQIIRLKFIQFVFEVIQDIVKKRQNEVANQVQFRQNLTEILQYKCPNNLDELNQQVKQCENNQALESGKFIFSKLYQLIEEIKKATNDIQK